MAPPWPLVEEPEAIKISPLPVLLKPVDRVSWPVVETELPTDPIVTSPVPVVTEEPLVTRTLPPLLRFPEPAVNSMLLPKPAPLLPTDR